MVLPIQDIFLISTKIKWKKLNLIPLHAQTKGSAAIYFLAKLNIWKKQFEYFSANEFSSSEYECITCKLQSSIDEHGWRLEENIYNVS